MYMEACWRKSWLEPIEQKLGLLYDSSMMAMATPDAVSKARRGHLSMWRRIICVGIETKRSSPSLSSTERR